MKFTQKEWFEIAMRATSGDMVTDILSDWAEDILERERLLEAEKKKLEKCKKRAAILTRKLEKVEKSLLLERSW